MNLEMNLNVITKSQEIVDLTPYRHRLARDISYISRITSRRYIIYYILYIISTIDINIRNTTLLTLPHSTWNKCCEEKQIASTKSC